MRKLLLLCLLAAPLLPASSQETGDKGIRPPVIAGTFYAADPGVLTRDLEFLFSRALPRKAGGEVLAVIVPHAGHPFSGEVAASGYHQVARKKSYENIFLIGSSHNFAFPGAAIYRRGNFLTPLGEVPVNTGLADELYKKHQLFVDHDTAHYLEHSLEIQLPFLQYYLGTDIQIVPILMGTQATGTCRKLADALKPYLNGDNLFVISADLSHFPGYEDANAVDRFTLDAICTQNPDQFLKALRQNARKNIPNLQTSACAWPAILTLMYMTSGDAEHLEYDLVQYRNSGDARIGDKSRVVGYGAVTVRRKAAKDDHGFRLSEEEKMILVGIARSSLDTFIKKGEVLRFDSREFPPALLVNRGAFVTLMKNGRLRGCIGQFQPESSLCDVVRDMAIAAATQDLRFTPVRVDELDEIELEISVLSPFVRISDTSEIELGRHGIYIRKGPNQGTFLPKVATQNGWDLDEFLGHCAMEKARIGWYGWKSAEIYAYEALVFMERDLVKE